MIGLAQLRDGAYTLDHPEGPCWVLIRGGRIVRAEQFVAEINRIIVWPQDVARQWAINVKLANADLRRGVIFADARG